MDKTQKIPAKSKGYFLILVTVLVVGLVSLVATQSFNRNVSEVKGVTTQTSQIAIVVVKTDVATTEYEVEVNEPKNALSVLKDFDSKSEDFSITTKSDASFGEYVTGLNNLEAKPENNEFWSIFVNGKMSELGISSLTLYPLDKLEFVLSKF